MGRPVKNETVEALYLKEQFDGANDCINALEVICKTSNSEQKEERTGEIGLLVGKLQIRLANIEERLGIYDE